MRAGIVIKALLEKREFVLLNRFHLRSMKVTRGRGGGAVGIMVGRELPHT